MIGIKEAVKDWMSEKFDSWVKTPIENTTKKYEDQAQIKNPGGYYWKQEAFYRGLFWIAVGLLVVLWVITGS